MRIKEGQNAKDFTVKDVFGKTISLSDYKGRKVLLSFFAFASCNFCNLRVHRLMEHYDSYKAKGMDVIAFFEASTEDIMKYVGKQKPPFPIIPDRDKEIYNLYGVESKWSSFFGLVPKMFSLDYFRALRKGFMTRSDMFHANMRRAPAEILIGSDYTIHKAYYGKNLADHLHFDEIDYFSLDKMMQ